MIGGLLLAGTGGAMAQDEGGGVDCVALYAELANRWPVALEQCEPQPVSYALEECTPPHDFSGGGATTHIVLAIDASGSMAGSAGSVSKMEAAKREARAFLGDVHEDVAVGLMVYGHKGSNKPEGRAESCAAAEMVHGFDAPRRALGESIEALRPVGYTPIAGALEAAGRQLAALPEPKEGEAEHRAVVYLISDGEETCEGDPVGAAQALAEAGVEATVNTIGFAVDAETEAQLAAIAEAGGGTYYPAEDANALQRQLNAIAEAEASGHRYGNCVNRNAGLIGVATHNEILRITACYQKNGPARGQNGVNKFFREAKKSNAPEAACEGEVQLMAMRDRRAAWKWLPERSDALNAKALEEIRAYRDGAKLGVE
ncbi:VWA domain-containing protein [Oceanicola sp. D3]|uniref:vWA domain-containing protein n=1 Tax=Oceanicola sp. D3 TaxID=2587163 RepID=UPI001AEFF560|nr:VWA domain-containing protein [Oceanicola sp. D3]